MSKNSILVAFGSIWTFFSVLYITDMAVATPELWSLAMPFALGMLVSAGYWWACSMVDAMYLRATANFVHISVSVLWVAWVVSLYQAALSPNQGVVLVFAMALGAALADMGSFGDPQVEKRRAMFLGESAPRTFRPLSAVLSAYDSGRFSAPQLSACDSGGFPQP